MKNIPLKIVFLMIFCVSASAQNTRLLGTWESKDQESPVKMILDDKGFITFNAGGQLLGGVGYNVDGELLRMTYKTHEKDSQIKITITIRDLIKKKILKRDTGTVVFLDSNNIEVCFKKTMEDPRNTIEQDCRSFLKIM